MFLPKFEQILKLHEGFKRIRHNFGQDVPSDDFCHPFQPDCDPALAHPICLALTTPGASGHFNFERLEFLGYACLCVHCH